MNSEVIYQLSYSVISKLERLQTIVRSQEMKSVSSVSKVGKYAYQSWLIYLSKLKFMENKYVAPEEIAMHFGSKLDMHNVLSIDSK